MYLYDYFKLKLKHLFQFIKLLQSKSIRDCFKFNRFSITPNQFHK